MVLDAKPFREKLGIDAMESLKVKALASWETCDNRVSPLLGVTPHEREKQD